MPLLEDSLALLLKWGNWPGPLCVPQGRVWAGSVLAGILEPSLPSNSWEVSGCELETRAGCHSFFVFSELGSRYGSLGPCVGLVESTGRAGSPAAKCQG